VQACNQPLTSIISSFNNSWIYLYYKEGAVINLCHKKNIVPINLSH
jgi:hypothetical protein